MFVKGGDGGLNLPEISNSLRFDGVNDYLTRMPSSAGSGTTLTFSAWIKRSNITTTQSIYSCTVNSQNYSSIGFGLAFSGAINLEFIGAYGNSVQFRIAGTQVFRDVSGWYHIVGVFDTNNATANDRVRLYVNGVRMTSLTDNQQPAQGYTYPYFNALTYPQQISSGMPYYNAYYFDGYMASICYLDGQALTPSSFAYTDPNGQWRSLPKSQLVSLASAGGVNSFFLPFDNGASAATLGADASSKGNNWTLTNMVRDGSIDDCWSYDTPTNNFATPSPLVNNASGNITWSKGNQQVAIGVSGQWRTTVIPFSLDVNSYTEITLGNNVAASDVMVGLLALDQVSVTTGNYYPGQNSAGYCYQNNGTKINSGSNTTYGSAWTASGSVVGIAYNVSTRELSFYLNGVSQGVAYTLPVGEYVVALGGANSIPQLVVNCGQRPVASGAWDNSVGGYFRYAPPAGFKALSTKNLSSGSVTTSGSFTGNASTNGPFVFLNGTPTSMTIDSNAVTWGVHADKLSNGFKIRTASSPYNDVASNSYTVTTNDGVFKYNNAEVN